MHIHRLYAVCLGALISVHGPAANAASAPAKQAEGDALKEDLDARFEHLLRRAREEKEAFIAILVDGDTGKILAEGINTSHRDPTDHSEVAAIRNLAKALPQDRWRNLILYTTAEPCPMCSGALVYSKIGRVVYGIDREALYAKGWHDFRLRTADIIADARRSGGFVPELVHYTGPHLHDCEGLFHR